MAVAKEAVLTESLERIPLICWHQLRFWCEFCWPTLSNIALSLSLSFSSPSFTSLSDLSLNLVTDLSHERCPRRRFWGRRRRAAANTHAEIDYKRKGFCVPGSHAFTFIFTSFPHFLGGRATETKIWKKLNVRIWFCIHGVIVDILCDVCANFPVI